MRADDSDGPITLMQHEETDLGTRRREGEMILQQEWLCPFPPCPGKGRAPISSASWVQFSESLTLANKACTR